MALFACEERTRKEAGSSHSPLLGAFTDSLEAAAGKGARIAVRFSERKPGSLLGVHGAELQRDSEPPLHSLVLVEQTARGFRKLSERVGAAAYAPDGEILFVRDGTLFRTSGAGVRPLASGVLSDFAIDGPGQLIAVVRPGIAHQSAIEILGPDGASQGLVIAAEGSNTLPLFTPDGRLLYVSGRTGVVSLFWVDLDGKKERQLTNVGLLPGAAVLGASFVAPPVTWRGMRWEDDERLTYDAGDEWLTVELATGRIARVEAKP
jgi:hypothetical protein